MKLFINKYHNQVVLYEFREETWKDYSGRERKHEVRKDLAILRTDHELREKVVLKFISRARIAGLGFSAGLGFRDSLEFEMETTEDELKKLAEVLQVSVTHTEVQDVLREYAEGRMTFEEIYDNLLPYVVAKKLKP